MVPPVKCPLFIACLVLKFSKNTSIFHYTHLSLIHCDAFRTWLHFMCWVSFATCYHNHFLHSNSNYLLNTPISANLFYDPISVLWSLLLQFLITLLIISRRLLFKLFPETCPGYWEKDIRNLRICNWILPSNFYVKWFTEWLLTKANYFIGHIY